MEKIINLLNTLLDYLKAYGAEGVFWLAVVGYIFSMIMPQFQSPILTSNNIIILGMLALGIKFSTQRGIDIRMHKIWNKNRLEANLAVRNELLNLKSELDATRVYIFEMHNGNRNNGNLPFLYADMTFEETNGVNDISREYQNMNISLYPFAEYIFNNQVYMGGVEGIKEIDRKFYNRVAEQGTEYCAMAVLRHQGHIIGMLGVSLDYEITDVNKMLIYKALVNHGDIISDYLTLK